MTGGGTRAAEQAFGSSNNASNDGVSIVNMVLLECGVGMIADAGVAIGVMVCIVHVLGVVSVAVAVIIAIISAWLKGGGFLEKKC